MYSGTLIDQLTTMVERAEKRATQPAAVQELEALFALTPYQQRQQPLAQDLLGVA